MVSPRAPARSVFAGDNDVALSAGTSPNSRHASTDTPAVNANICVFHVRSMKMLPNPDAICAIRIVVKPRATTMPSTRADERQQHAFHEQLHHQPAAGGADGEAHRHFSFARAGAGQQQIGEVRARDQQHEAGRAKQHRQRLAELRANVRHARGRRHRGDLVAVTYCFSAFRRIAGWQRGGHDLGRQRRQVIDRLLPRCGPAPGGRSRRATTCCARLRGPRRYCVSRSPQIGSATSKRRPTSRPKKSGGATPMMSNFTPSRRTVCCSTDGAPPNSRCQ